MRSISFAPTALDLFWIDYPGLRSRCVAGPGLLFFALSGFSLFHSFRNSFHSATLWALRRWAVTGSSFGARGTVSSFRPASCGRRSALRWFTSLRGPDQVFPCVLATARAGHDVVQAAFVRAQQRRCIGSGCRRVRGCSSR